MESKPGRNASRKTLRVLVVAYACEPGRGSEPGAGWGLVRAVRSFAECTVLVAPEHTAEIRRHDANHPDPGLSFVEVAEPRWARFAKWHRIPWFLAYLAWLRRARKVASELHERRPFEVAHHATYAAFWLPSPVTKIGIPSVWGPVGGAVRTPRRLWPLLGVRGVVTELVDWGAVWAGSLVPATRRTWRAASVLLLQNTETARRVERVQQVRSTLLNHALFTQVPPVAATRADYLLWAAPLESRKGPRLAVRALARTPEHVRLVMVGDGPERRAVERLAQRLDVAHRLELRGWVPRDEVLELMGGAAGVIFTGLREEGGLALAEAMLSGAPVIVLAHGGARTIAERAVDAGRVALIEPAGLSAAAQEMARAMTRFVDDPPGGSGPLLDQEAARRELEAAFRSALEGSPPD